jgi:hypothetical protein
LAGHAGRAGKRSSAPLTLRRPRDWTLPADPDAGLAADAVDIVAEGDVELGEY